MVARHPLTSRYCRHSCNGGQRYFSTLSTVDCCPSRSNFVLSQASARSPSHLRQVGQIVPVCIELVEGAQLGHHVGGLNAVYQHPLHRVSRILPASVSLVTKAIARISRISEQLKLISLMRFMISLAVVEASPARVE
jgi:hypothetical protein